MADAEVRPVGAKTRRLFSTALSASDRGSTFAYESRSSHLQKTVAR